MIRTTPYSGSSHTAGLVRPPPARRPLGPDPQPRPLTQQIGGGPGQRKEGVDALALPLPGRGLEDFPAALDPEPIALHHPQHAQILDLGLLAQAGGNLYPELSLPPDLPVGVLGIVERQGLSHRHVGDGDLGEPGHELLHRETSVLGLALRDEYEDGEERQNDGWGPHGLLIRPGAPRCQRKPRFPGQKWLTPFAAIRYSWKRFPTLRRKGVLRAEQRNDRRRSGSGPQRRPRREVRPRRPRHLLDRLLGSDHREVVAVPPDPPGEHAVPPGIPRRPPVLRRVRGGPQAPREPAGPALLFRLSGGRGGHPAPRDGGPAPRRSRRGAAGRAAGGRGARHAALRVGRDLPDGALPALPGHDRQRLPVHRAVRPGLGASGSGPGGSAPGARPASPWWPPASRKRSSPRRPASAPPSRPSSRITSS